MENQGMIPDPKNLSPLHRRGMVVLTAGLLFCTQPLRADLILKSRLQSSGLAGLGAFKMESLSHQNDVNRDDQNTTHFTGALLKWVSGKKGMDTRNIVRLDKEVIWDIKAKDKEYTELTFEEQHRLLQQGLTSMQPEGASSGQNGGAPIRSAGEPTVEVQETGKTFKVSGFEGKGVLATVTMPYYDSTENRLDTLVVRYDGYLCHDAALSREMNTFNQAYADKLKISMASLRGLDILFRYLEKPMAKLGEKLGKDGVPLKFNLTLMKPKGPADASKGGDDASASGNQGDSEEESLHLPTSTGDAAGQAMKSAFGFFKKKHDKAKAEEQEKAAKEKQAAAAAKGVPTTWVEISSNDFEYTEIQIAKVDPATFDLPAGYKKVVHPSAQRLK
jgi:hypothetical protein